MLENTDKLDALIQKYQGKQGILIPLLQEAQELYGHINKELMLYLSAKTEIPAAEIFGVATFYSMFKLKAQGRHVIKICKGTACHVSDVDSIKFALIEQLKLLPGEDTTSDMRFTLVEVACLGCCSLAPVIMIDDRTYGKLAPEDIVGILAKYT
ncbi:MAG TPA: NAD(P)H-dependent oxidoreductase subunit E [Candidatus Cloacimonadota bacterium]|nr:NAD(P)H-dependent oxidoreductase subunit E [Candidatus Cloacimonadota bacterium]